MKDNNKKLKYKKIRNVFILGLMVIFILIVLIMTFLTYEISGSNYKDLENISIEEKDKIINFMNLEPYANNISLEKVEIPKAYKDIYYKIYFSTNNNEIDFNSVTNDLYIRFENIEENQYSCDISNMGKNIEILDQIINN